MNDQEKRENEVVKENEIKHADNRILSEIYADDRNQVRDIMANGEQTLYKFPNKSMAGAFHIASILKGLEKLGVPAPAKIPDIEKEAIFDQHNIKFERRIDNEESWRSGVYIYKNNELAYFVSMIVDARPNSMVITSEPRYRVVTNAMRA